MDECYAYPITEMPASEGGFFTIKIQKERSYGNLYVRITLLGKPFNLLVSYGFTNEDLII